MHYLAFAVLLPAAYAVASPGSDEFKRCHTVAAKYLQICLDERPGYSGSECWSHAKRSNEKYYKDVMAAHAPGPSHAHRLQSHEVIVSDDGGTALADTKRVKDIIQRLNRVLALTAELVGSRAPARGSEYDLALAHRGAMFIHERLAAAGVPPSRLTVLSLGSDGKRGLWKSRVTESEPDK